LCVADGCCFAGPGEADLDTNAEAEGELLLRATERMYLTARGYHRVLPVARTIADLDGTHPRPPRRGPVRSGASRRSGDDR
jgi:predicted ATPase with chaperone activity